MILIDVVISITIYERKLKQPDKSRTIKLTGQTTIQACR